MLIIQFEKRFHVVCTFISIIIIFVINFEKWDTQTQALDIKLFDIIKKHLLYTHQCIVQNTGGTKQWNTN